MKREGRQHGLVRTYPLCSSEFDRRPQPRYNRSDMPPTVGLGETLVNKPANHSKFTGKCGKPRCSGCHLHPVCKSKVKSKGTQKLRSMLMDEPSSDKYGLPTMVILDQLATYYSYTSDCDVTDDCDANHVLEHAEDDDDDDWCLV